MLGIDEEAFRFEKVPHFSRKNKLRNEIVSGSDTSKFSGSHHLK